MNNENALELIRTGIDGLLFEILSGTDAWITPEDLAEEKQLTAEDVFECIYHSRENSLTLITMDGVYTDEFTLLIIDVLETIWFEKKYQRAVTEAREGIIEEKAWEETKKSLMPTSF